MQLSLHPYTLRRGKPYFLNFNINVPLTLIFLHTLFYFSDRLLLARATLAEGKQKF
jgi:hypothetical protein